MEELYGLGIGMEETMRYLFQCRPAADQFREWLEANRKHDLEVDTKGMEDVLSASDLDFWEKNGYLLIKSAVPRADCEATQMAIFEHLDGQPDDPRTWYKPHADLRGLMLSFTDHPCLSKNRKSAKIKKAYEQLYHNAPIYLRIDKVSFNPPETNFRRFAGDGLHWDVSLKQPIQYALQGLLYLTDCGPEDGAFHCVPGFHQQIGGWLKQLPAGSNPRGVAPNSLKPLAVPGQAGDFVIWHQALPHCATPNHGSFPRMVQYLTYLPLGYQEEKEWL